MTTEATSVTVVQNVRIFDGNKVIPTGSVLIEQGLIADVRPRITPPAGSLVVDGRDRTLLPGFLDCHTHLARRMPEQAVVFGVTTELDMSAYPTSAPTRPPVEAAVPAASARPHRSEHGAQDPAEDMRIVLFPAGSPGLPASGDLVQVTVTTAHERRRLIIAHVTSAHSARQAVEAGVDGLAHLFVDEPVDAEFVEAVAEARTFVIPTLTALEALCGSPSGAGLAVDPRLTPFLDARCRTALTQALPLVDPPLRLEYARDAVARLRTAGVPILTGTDAPNPGTAAGISIHRELELLVSAGLTPVEALAAATSVPAHCFGLDDRGRIARGLHADLLLVDGDPTTDIRATRAIAGVWRRGAFVDRDAARVSFVPAATSA